jgi:hypothetical protein
MMMIQGENRMRTKAIVIATITAEEIVEMHIRAEEN